jgi:tetratricopeptide (TPR) repeat protein
VDAEVRMKPIRSVTIVLVLLCTQACSRIDKATGYDELDRSCRVVIAASVKDDREIASLQRDLRERRAPARTAEQLGYRFVARARLSGDAGFYKVAEQAAACAESIEPNEPAALLLRGHVLHQLHHFSEAERIARRLVTVREFVLDYGLLGDALMEQGRLTEAAGAYQKMIDLKPFYQSYTRAAHLRWLKGDLEGAVELMQAAVKASSPRDPESVAWAYSRLATYELQRGRLVEAAASADAALRFVPDYAAGLLARGRIQLAQGKDAEAVGTLRRAVERNPQPEYQWTLADALRLVNRAHDAAAVETELTRTRADDPRTLALYLATRREDVALAVSLARRELENRRDVFTLDALAWALVRAGRVDEATPLMERALAEGTQDGRLFLHAAVIAAAAGRQADAARWAHKARMLRFTLFPSELGVLRGGIATLPHS